MDKWGFLFGAVCLLLSAAWVLWTRWNTRKTLDTLARMLSAARDGRFQESTFDESRLSALETQFAQFLSASAVSARTLSQEKDRINTLIADLSHQTKTPIANLLLYAELLQEENLSPQAAEEAATLQAQAEKLRFLIDTLVKLSRLENGVISLHPTPGPLSPMLHQVEGQFAPLAAKKGLSLHFQETTASACFDAKWTAEALCNLVDNAIKYTDQGGIRVRVIPYELFLRIDVEDTGPGIPEGDQAKIFSRFYRGDQHAQQDGLGIGLSLTREILQSEGGYVKVTSDAGSGSTFSLFLPQ